MNRTVLIMVTVAILAATGGYYVARALDSRSIANGGTTGAMDSLVAADDLLGKPRPDFSLNTMDGTVFSASEMDGQVWLLNFWATWCKPCVDEMPMLSQLNNDNMGNGVKVVGVALDDAERAGLFARELAISYPILVGEADVVLTGRRYGNATGMLPFSVLVDADGIIRWVKLGALDRSELLKQIELLN